MSDWECTALSFYFQQDHPSANFIRPSCIILTLIVTLLLSSRLNIGTAKLAVTALNSILNRGVSLPEVHSWQSLFIGAVMITSSLRVVVIKNSEGRKMMIIADA